MLALLALRIVVLIASTVTTPVIPPAPDRRVTDTESFLSPAVRDRLETTLAQFEQRTGHQVLVWIGPTSGDVPLEEFCARAFQSWRVGRRGLDDGVVLFVFARDRRVRIEVGYGLESAITDAQASRIIREVIVPRIASGDRDGAISTGVQELVALAERSHEGGPVRRTMPAAKLVAGVLFALLLLVLFIRYPRLAFFIFASMGSRRSHGGPGGGGFHGGGGRSGGGGASGSW